MAATAAFDAFDAQARTSDRRNGHGREFAPQRTAPGEGQGQRGGGAGPRLLHRGSGRESRRIPSRRGVSGSTVASALSSCWLSTSQCCRWWNSRWKWTLSFAFLCLRLSSRLSKCPSLSFLFVLFSERLCLSRSWWNSWSKCQRFCPIPCSSSRLPSRSSIFRFRAVEEVLVEVFKVFPKDRVPQRLRVSRPSFLLVEVFKGFPKDRVPQRLPVSRPSLLIVFKVFPEDRVPQRLPLSRPSFLLVEVFKVFPKDRVPQRLPVSRPSFLLVEVFKGFPKDRVPQRLPVSRPSLLIVFKVFPEDRVPQRLPLSRLFPRLFIDRCHELVSLAWAGSRLKAVMTSGCAWSMWRTTVVMTNLALYSSSGVRIRCSASLPVWNRRTVMRLWHMRGWLRCAPRGSSFCCQAKMPGISAGMFQKDSYALWHMHGWFAGYVAPRAVSLMHSSGVLTVSSDVSTSGVLTLGYVTNAGAGNWKVLNSWGSSWCLQGYFCLQRGKGGADACGLLAVLARAGSSGAGCVEDSCFPHFCSLRNSLSSR